MSCDVQAKVRHTGCVPLKRETFWEHLKCREMQRLAKVKKCTAAPAMHLPLPAGA